MFGRFGWLRWHSGGVGAVAVLPHRVQVRGPPRGARRNVLPFSCGCTGSTLGATRAALHARAYKGHAYPCACTRAHPTGRVRGRGPAAVPVERRGGAAGRLGPWLPDHSPGGVGLLGRGGRGAGGAAAGGAWGRGGGEAGTGEAGQRAEPPGALGAAKGAARAGGCRRLQRPVRTRAARTARAPSPSWWPLAAARAATPTCSMQPPPARAARPQRRRTLTAAAAACLAAPHAQYELCFDFRTASQQPTPPPAIKHGSVASHADAFAQLVRPRQAITADILHAHAAANEAAGKVRAPVCPRACVRSAARASCSSAAAAALPGFARLLQACCCSGLRPRIHLGPLSQLQASTSQPELTEEQQEAAKRNALKQMGEAGGVARNTAATLSSSVEKLGEKCANPRCVPLTVAHSGPCVRAAASCGSTGRTSGRHCVWQWRHSAHRAGASSVPQLPGPIWHGGRGVHAVQRLQGAALLLAALPGAGGCRRPALWKRASLLRRGVRLARPARRV